jgi:hypothetical protein
MEVEQRYVVKFFVEEGMKRVEIIHNLNKHHDGDALQRTQVYYWIKEVKWRKKNLSNGPPREGPDDCIATALKEDPHLSTRKIAKALNSSSARVRNQLTRSLGMKCYHMRCVPHTLAAAQRAKRAETAGSWYKRWKAIQPPTATSCKLVMSVRCSVRTIAKPFGQRRGRKWTNLNGPGIVMGKRWSVRSSMVQGSTS